jgi:hypothetical protein
MGGEMSSIIEYLKQHTGFIIGIIVTIIVLWIGSHLPVVGNLAAPTLPNATGVFP